MTVHIDYPEGFRPKRFVKKLSSHEIGRITEATLLENGFLDRLKELLDYNPTNGEFTRKISTSSNAKVGDIAGSFTPKGYCVISIDGRLFRAHRLAWLYATGSWPKEEIDHISQVTGTHFDNRLENLREASSSENGRNQTMRNDNTSGFYGVSWHKRDSKWRANIRHHGKEKSLGYFNTAEEAARAYDKAAREFHGPYCKQNFPEEAA